MKPLADSLKARRVAKIFGWAFAVAIAVGLTLPFGWRMLEVTEARAISATRENLASSLTALMAEQVARGEAADGRWLRGDPFRLLRWRQENYCGDLLDGNAPRRGCWHYLPQRQWVLYRNRFGGGQEAGQEIHAYALKLVPEQSETRSRKNRGDFVSIELQPVPAKELAGTYANE